MMRYILSHSRLNNGAFECGVVIKRKKKKKKEWEQERNERRD